MEYKDLLTLQAILNSSAYLSGTSAAAYAPPPYPGAVRYGGYDDLSSALTVPSITVPGDVYTRMTEELEKLRLEAYVRARREAERFARNPALWAEAMQMTAPVRETKKAASLMAPELKARRIRLEE